MSGQFNGENLSKADRKRKKVREASSFWKKIEPNHKGYFRDGN